MNIRINTLGAVAALLLIASIVPAFAQGTMGGKMTTKPTPAPKMAGKMPAKMAAPVYVCKTDKMAYSEADAKKMGMKDAKGDKLVKMATLPTGYMMHKMDSKMSGSKMATPKMGGKMAPKMGDGKMAPKKP